MSSFKSNENIYKKEDGSYYVVSADNASLASADGMANRVDPAQTAPDLGLHSLPRPTCPKT